MRRETQTDGCNQSRWYIIGCDITFSEHIDYCRSQEKRIQTEGGRSKSCSQKHECLPNLFSAESVPGHGQHGRSDKLNWIQNMKKLQQRRERNGEKKLVKLLFNTFVFWGAVGREYTLTNSLLLWFFFPLDQKRGTHNIFTFCRFRKTSII